MSKDIHFSIVSTGAWAGSAPWINYTNFIYTYYVFTKNSIHTAQLGKRDWVVSLWLALKDLLQITFFDFFGKRKIGEFKKKRNTWTLGGNYMI